METLGSKVLSVELAPDNYPLDFLEDDKAIYDLWRLAIVDTKYEISNSETLRMLGMNVNLSFAPAPSYDIILSTSIGQLPFMTINWAFNRPDYLPDVPHVAGVLFNLESTWALPKDVVFTAITTLCDLFNNNNAGLQLHSIAHYIDFRPASTPPYILTRVTEPSLSKTEEDDITDPVKLCNLLTNRSVFYSSLWEKFVDPV